MDELMIPESEALITWQRWNALEILDHNEVEYDQVLIVDADSIVHPKCPDFFKLTNNKFTSQYLWKKHGDTIFISLLNECEKFVPIFMVQGFGLARFKKENPHVCRIILKKLCQFVLLIV